MAETLAINRAKKLFGAAHANRPTACRRTSEHGSLHGGLLSRGYGARDVAFAHGGHLTHGTKISFSGKLYHALAYSVRRDTELIDYDEACALAREHKPKLIIAGASAYPRTMDYAPFREIADEVGAKLLVDMAHIAGLVAVGLHPHRSRSPCSSHRRRTSRCAARVAGWS